VALLMPYVMDFNREACVPEFARIALAMGAEREGRSDEDLSREAVDRVAALFGTVGIPRTLADLGVPEDRLDWVAEQSATVQRLVNNNTRALGVAELTAIIRAAFAGTRPAATA
jgi:alcohol dehydrogenase